MSGSQLPLNPTNELAKERTRAAAERTLSSWINNCLVLIGFGITVDQIFPGLEQLISRQHDRTLPEVIHITGLSFIGLGIVLLLIVMIQHFFILQWLKQSENQFKTTLFLRLNQVSIATILMFGILSLIMILSELS
jgi:putative membrane protein